MQININKPLIDKGYFLDLFGKLFHYCSHLLTVINIPFTIVSGTQEHYVILKICFFMISKVKLFHNKTNMIKITTKAITILSLLLISFGTVGAQAVSVPNSQVKWGCATNEASSDVDFGCPDEVSIVTGPWLLDGWKQYHTTWINKFEDSANEGKTPYVFAYMIAGLARRDQGLQDCDLTTMSICTDGANYIRDNLVSIQNEYQSVADNILESYGDKEMYIHMEPDYFLYHSSDLQKNPLSLLESHNIMNSLTNILATTLPNAKIVMDVSSWNPDLVSWHDGFENVSYGGLVGKVFQADENPDGKTYEEIQTQTGVPLIVDTAHTYGGFFTQYQSSWEAENHGVYSVIQAPSNNTAYSAFLSSINTQIVDVPYYKVKTFDEEVVAQN